MSKMKARIPIMAEPGVAVPDVYTYADSIKTALEKGRIINKRPLFNGITTMKNT